MQNELDRMLLEARTTESYSQDHDAHCALICAKLVMLAAVTLGPSLCRGAIGV